MNLWHASQEGMRDIMSHGFRSSLTILGVILGVAALLVMSALTEGMAVQFRYQLESTGDLEKIFIRKQAPPPRQASLEDTSPGITYKDVEALRNASPLITWISPILEVGGRVYFNGLSDNTRVKGAEPDFMLMDKHQMAAGRFITSDDIKNQNRVVVLGSRIMTRIFGRPDAPEALGAVVKINDISFKVVGYFPVYLSLRDQRLKEQGVGAEQEAKRKLRKSRGRGYDPFSWKNDLAVIPLTTMQSTFKSAEVVNGVDLGPDPVLSEIQVGTGNVDRMRSVEEQVRNTLLQTHHGVEDFALVINQDQIDQMDKNIRSARLSGGIIAVIGIIVGGVGIMNIMLASIVDRIREIGVRRAIGASPRDIFVQVMMEAVILALIGGIAGLLAGWGLAVYLDKVVQIDSAPVIRKEAVLLSFVFALVTGLLAGIYPALKASLLSPVQALKYD